MNNSQFWNNLAKQSLLIGVIMSCSKVIELSILSSGNGSHLFLYGVEWVISIVLFITLLFYSVKRYAANFSAEEGFSYSKSIRYTILLSIFTAIPIALVSHIYITSIVGYEVYVEGSISTLVSILESSNIEGSMIDMYNTLFDAMREAPQPSLFTSIIDTIFSYAFAGAIIGLVIGLKTRRQPVIFNNNEE